MSQQYREPIPKKNLPQKKISRGKTKRIDFEHFKFRQAVDASNSIEKPKRRLKICRPNI